MKYCSIIECFEMQWKKSVSVVLASELIVREILKIFKIDCRNSFVPRFSPTRTPVRRLPLLFAEGFGQSWIRVVTYN